MDFNFHELAFLAKVDPEAFEIRRSKTIDQFLNESSDRQKVLGKCLQREIDAERKRVDDPQLAFAAISKMMWQHVAFLCDGLNDFSAVVKQFNSAHPSVPTMPEAYVTTTANCSSRATISPTT